jgi:hypothetical protein
MKLPGELKATLRTQMHIDQRDVRTELFGTPERLGGGRGHADDRDAPALKKSAGDIKKVRVVVDDYTPQRLGSQSHP